MLKQAVNISNHSLDRKRHYGVQYKYWDTFYEADRGSRAICGRSLAGITGLNPAGGMDARYSASVPEKKKHNLTHTAGELSKHEGI